MEGPAATLHLGIDLGGSGFRVRAVRVVEREPLVLEVDPREREVEERWGGSFRPVPLAAQLAEGAAPRVTEAEEREACERAERVGAAVRLVAGGRAARVAVAAPGLKTADRSGVVAARFGPRDPALLAHLREAAGVGLEVAARLAGDGLAGARGEQAADGGALRGVARGLYLGGGSGVAEALVLAGGARELDALEPPWPRAFELPLEPPTAPAEGESYQDALSPRRLLEDPAALLEPAGPTRFARRLEELVRRRAAAVRALLPGAEPPLERVVLAQAFAFLPTSFLAPALAAVRDVELRLSTLRAAPSLGAVALALDHEAREGARAWSPSGPA